MVVIIFNAVFVLFDNAIYLLLTTPYCLKIILFVIRATTVRYFTRSTFKTFAIKC